MHDERNGVSIARLADGRVIVCGGQQSVGHFPIITVGLNQVEIFDPVTEQWTQVAPMSKLHGSVNLLLLADGRVFAAGFGTAEIYDPTTDRWTLVPDWPLLPYASRINLLPDGRVLISGGTSGSVSADFTVAVSSTSLFDLRTGRSERGENLRTPRAGHAVVVWPNGSVWLLGGMVTVTTPTSTVEGFPWEPQLTMTLDPGFYVATANQNQLADDGEWTLEVFTPGAVAGGMNLGGVLPGGGKDVAFAAFSLSQPQTVTSALTLLSLPGTIGSADVRLQLFDANGNPIGSPVQGGGSLQWSQNLQPGFYVMQLRSSDSGADTAFHMTVNASGLPGGAIAGGGLRSFSGVTGYLGFYVPGRQDITIRLRNEGTYGRPRGAGEIYLTLYDAAGRRLKSSGPGATQ